MPSTGGPSSSSSVRSSGAPSEYTEAGPPERTIARAPRSRITDSGVSCGRSSANTPHSRIRRAMSCEYCPPKSKTTTPSRGTGGARPGRRERGVLGTRATEDAAWRCLCPRASASVIRDGYRLGDRGATVRAHPDRLLALELLPLGLEGRRHHHLRALEVADVLVAAGRHRRPERPEQVE